MTFNRAKTEIVKIKVHKIVLWKKQRITVLQWLLIKNRCHTHRAKASPINGWIQSMSNSRALVAYRLIGSKRVSNQRGWAFSRRALQSVRKFCLLFVFLLLVSYLLARVSVFAAVKNTDRRRLISWRMTHRLQRYAVCDAIMRIAAFVHLVAMQLVGC